MRKVLIVALLLTGSPASAEVISAEARGFELSSSVTLTVPVARAYAAFTQVGAWWDDQHTYSGKGANMRLEPRAGGCLCEALPAGGGVEHLRIAVVQPGERIVLTGGLGPLLYQAAGGVMDVKFERAGGGSKVTMTYRAAGFANGGADKMAPLVDRVLAGQMQRYRVHAQRRRGR